jgi:hypothetical protein
MKKLLVIVAACVLLLAFAVPAMADVSWGGGILFSFITDFGGTSAWNYWWAWNDVTVTPDDYNTVYAAFAGNAVTSWNVDQFNLKTDLGMLLGLPIGLTNTIGTQYVVPREFQASATGNEMTYEVWTTYQIYQYNGIKLGLDLGAATIDISTSIGQDFNSVEADNQAVISVFANVPEAGPADIELYYIIAGDPDFKGQLGVNAKLDFDPLTAAAGFWMDVAKASGYEWIYGVGAKFAVSDMLNVSAGVDGNDIDILNTVGICADASLTDVFGATVAAGLSFAEGTDSFQGVDVSAYATAGDATWRLGYIVTSNGYAWGTTAALLDGGLYIVGTITW